MGLRERLLNPLPPGAAAPASVPPSVLPARAFLFGSTKSPAEHNLVLRVRQALTCRTSIAVQPLPTRAGTPGLKIPAFSAAISSTVSPRILVWSSLFRRKRKASERADNVR